VYNLISAGVIEAFRIGSRNGLLIRESEVLGFIEEQEFREGM
jgi:hypothetical protein